MTILFILALLLPFSQPARAALPKPGETTIWDRLMMEQSQRYMRDGALQLDDGHYREALDTFTKAVISTPEEPLAHVLLGAAYYWAGQVDRAEEEYHQALRLDPNDTQAHQLLGIAYVWRDKTDEAYKEFQTAARLTPRRADVQMNLGSVLEGRGELSSALDRYRLAVGLEPKHPLYRFQLGALYSRLGRVGEARNQLQEALRLYPAYQDAMLELGGLEEREGRAKDAEALFKRAVRNRPADSVARFRLACLQWRDKRFEDVRQTVLGGLHVTPLGGEGHLELSVAYRAGGKPPDKPGGAPLGPENPKPSGEAEPSPADPVDMLARNLQRLPADRRVKVEVQMVYLPEAELKPASKKETGDSLKRALGGGPRPIAVKREFILPADDPAAREAQLKAVADDLRGALGSKPPGQVHLGLDIKYETPAPGPGSSGDQAKVGYAPREDTNDLGLWVEGTAWMDLVREGMERLSDDAHLVRGLGHLSLGEADDAASEFKSVLAKSPREADAKLGLAVALVVAGRDKEAEAAFRDVLKQDPKNSSAKDALAWLSKPLPPAPAPAKKQ